MLVRRAKPGGHEGGRQSKPGLQKQKAVGEEVLHLSQHRQTAVTVVICKYREKWRVLLVPVIHLYQKTGVVSAGCV